jgi:hypothetical protein
VVVTFSPTHWSEELAELAAAARRALRERASAEPDDVGPTLRYEALRLRLEREAVTAVTRGEATAEVHDAHSIPTTGDDELSVTLFDVGGTQIPSPNGDDDREPAPAIAWPAATRLGDRAEWMIQQAVDGCGGLAPDTIDDVRLTRALYDIASVHEGSKPGAVSVLYEDGSEGPSFPRGIIEFGSGPLPPRQVVVQLMSSRHPEMDPETDGAWFANRDLSRRLPHGRLDAMAYEFSVEQLAAVARRGPVTLVVRQSGFEPAIVGLYRAVAEHLLKSQPQSLAVVPLEPAGGAWRRGRPWMRGDVHE